jgi:invasion protein IalB
MKTKHQFIGTALLLAVSLPAISDVNCEGPNNSSGRWSLVCSEDGKAISELKCNWKVNVVTEGGGKGNVLIKATIARKQKNTTVWSDGRFGGKKITEASLVGGGNCGP